MAVAAVTKLGESAGTAEAAPRWRKVAGTLGAAVLGAVLLVAAYAKALVPAAFAAEIRAQGLDFGFAPEILAIAGVAIEAGLGAALLLNLRRRDVLVVATLVVFFFLGLTGRTYWRFLHGTLADPAAGCGCFGNLVERTPREAFLEDLVLLLPALALAWIGRPRFERTPTSRLGIVVAVTLAAGLFAWKSPALPLDDLATDLAPGVTVANLCAGREPQRICLGSIDDKLLAGRHVVVLADVHAKEFPTLAAELNRWARVDPQLPITVLADFPPQEEMTLFFQYAPAFALHEIPGALLARLQRSMPRGFVVEGAKVTRTFAGLPPLAELYPKAAADSSKGNPPR